MLRRLATDAEIVLMGLDEAETLFGTRDVRALCAELFTTGCAEVIALKDGGNGAWIADHSQCIRLEPQPCHCIDPIGAGDGFNAGVLAFCRDRNVMLLPGVLTPTDVAICLQYGFRTMKLFPAGDMPRSYIKDLKGPDDNTHYVAIGGVAPDNIPEFRRAGYLGVGLASSLMPKDKVAARDWDACAEYVHALLEKAL